MALVDYASDSEGEQQQDISNNKVENVHHNKGGGLPPVNIKTDNNDNEDDDDDDEDDFDPQDAFGINKLQSNKDETMQQGTQTSTTAAAAEGAAVAASTSTSTLNRVESAPQVTIQVSVYCTYIHTREACHLD
jgi:hypothetical protein